MEQSEGYCQGMKRWMKYCSERVTEETPTAAYMVTDEDGEDEEGLYLYLDSGCNHTCHGELWLRKFVEKTGYEPPWLHQEEKELNGIGGKTKTLGEREFYIRLETTIGTQVPGEIASTEIQGSSAPMMLSLPSQASLGLVVDAESGTVYSKWLEKYFKVVRGPRNRLIGLKLITTHRQEDEIEEMGIAMMAEDEERAEENAASSSHVEERHTEEVREVPKRRRNIYQVKEVPRRPSEETWMDEERRRAEEIEEDDVAAYCEEGVEEEEPAVETSPEDQPDDEDVPAAVREDHTGEEDLEEHTEDGRLIRYHVVPRNKHFAPTGSRLDLPVDLARLKDERVTRKYYEDQSRHIETDSWRKEEVEKFVKNSYNAIHYQRGPHGVHLKRRVTRDLDTGEQLADEDENQLSDKTSLTRALDKMRNITTDFYFYEEYPDGKPWTGQTEFKIKPLDEELQESRYRLEPDDQARTLKKGQRKHLSEVAVAMEERDVAMWNILTRRPPKMMKSWKFLLELFAGCAVLTQMAQAMGYETCVPLDKHTGWDVFKAEHRRYAEDIVDKEQPYLLAIAFPCGPWSPWQNLVKDREAVLQRRKLWLPVLRWVKQMVIKQRNRGGVSLLENPWASQAWNTKELEYLEENFGGEAETRRYEVLRVDLCQLGLRDADSGKPHKKATGVGTDSPGIQAVMRSVPRCDGRHEHQVLEGSNSRGSRTRQAAKWTRKFCRRIIRGVQQDLEEMTRVAFAAEDRQEELEEKPGKMDAVYGPEDLPTSSVGQGADMEKDLQLQEDMEAIRREGDPEDEKVRRQEWLRLKREERIGIRRLHVMTSHATRPQLQRMLRHANAPTEVVRGVKFFRCSACESKMEETRPPVTKVPSPYSFNHIVGLDVFELKDSAETRFHVLHCVCHGSTFQVAEVLGEAKGVPPSHLCLQAFLRMWVNWAGVPDRITVDRGTHNRGIFHSELEKLGARFVHIAAEAPHQLGRTERHGGTLKRMASQVITASQAEGALEVQMAVTQAAEVKNGLASLGGFTPSQWVLDRLPRNGIFNQEDEEELVVFDEDPHSTFNRRNLMRETARAAWMQEDSSRRVRAAMLRKGGSEEAVYKTGDFVAFMRRRGGGPKWYGPARVLVQEGKNIWVLHGGVPIITSVHMVRPATAEQFLEEEILGKRKGKKRPRAFAREDVAQPHQLHGQAGQPGYLDFRQGQNADEGESMAQILGLDQPRAGTTVAGGDEESPKRRREMIEAMEAEEKDEKNARLQEAIDIPVPEDNEEYTPSIAPQEEPSQSSTPPVVPQMPQETELQRAMGASGGNQLDVGRRRSAGMQNEPTERTIREKQEVRREDRSRSPAEERGREFVAFMAKRSNNKPAGIKTPGEMRYENEPPEMQRKLDQSRGREWTNWVKYKAMRMRSLEEVEEMIQSGIQPIPMRWVDVDKNYKLRVEGGEEVPEKLKSRLVLRGDLEPGDYRVDCPTASHVGTHLVLSFAACNNYTLYAGDITAAFLQGTPISRKLLMKVPSSGIPKEDGSLAVQPGSFLIALMSIYGSRDAPRGFWIALRSEILAQGFREVEPALYALSDEQGLHGLAATHVDDVLWTGDQRLQEAMEAIQRRFTFGSVEQDNFRYCGRKIETTEACITMTAPELLLKVKPIHISGDRKRAISAAATPEEQSQMRGVLGSLGYVARLCRPELSYRCSALQGKQAKPVVNDLVQTNKFLQSAQKTMHHGIHYNRGRFSFRDAVLLSVTDASHAAETGYTEDGKMTGHKSQAGRFLLLASGMPSTEAACDFHVLQWSSHTLKRVCRSTLQAEVLSAQDGVESAHYVRSLIYSFEVPRVLAGAEGFAWKLGALDSRTIHWITDCRSFVSYMSTNGQGTVSDKRLAIDLTSLRQDLWRVRGEMHGEPSTQDGIPLECTDQLHWINTKDMISDAMTKAMVWDAILVTVQTGQWQLTEGSVRAHTGF